MAETKPEVVVYADEVKTFLTVLNVTDFGAEAKPKVEVLFTDNGAVQAYPFVFLVFREGAVFSLVGQPTTNPVRAAFHAELSNIANGIVARMVEKAAEEVPVPSDLVSAA